MMKSILTYILSEQNSGYNMVLVKKFESTCVAITALHMSSLFASYIIAK